MKHEVIIIGCGPAALSASIYLGRANIKTLIIGKQKQSQLMKAFQIENYFGFPDGIKGPELLERGLKQAKKFKVKVLDKEVVFAKKLKLGFQVKLDNNSTHSSKVLLISTGTPLKLSGITNEESLISKGVHYCAICDGPLYRNKKLAVIGNSNHAAEDALELAPFTNNITIISNDIKFKFSKQMQSLLKKHKIKLLNKEISEFKGKNKLEYLTIENKKIKFDAVFMACGTTSALNFAEELSLKTKGNILRVDENNQTNIEGIFAAGNCCASCRQIANNVGEGCNAALSVIKYLKHKNLYIDYGPLNKKVKWQNIQ
jgi:thioredoxin reductase (NADPH)